MARQGAPIVTGSYEVQAPMIGMPRRVALLIKHRAGASFSNPPLDAAALPHFYDAAGLPHFYNAAGLLHVYTAAMLPHFYTAAILPHFYTAAMLPHSYDAAMLPHFYTNSNPASFLKCLSA
eukprot:1159705-Pelagomonas_calceolata.AAC.9